MNGGARENLADQSHGKPNKLIYEKSPYLLQHAYNPVNWYPWAQEALDTAKRENKPIFLSIGYSSCHWCHVMEHESFEDEEIASILNENFVSIKVDREERPDLDEVYMKAVMSITGSGGWPLNVFLTPELEPFYGGTYFPKTSKYGLPGFGNLLKEIARSWKNSPNGIVDSASQIANFVKASYSAEPAVTKIDGHVLDDCFSSLAQAYDQELGGFSIAPKFPSPPNLLFLMRYYHRTGEKGSLQMVLKTLDMMMSGGIYDHLGGGFHRYSTDREWVVPHFEKMLYDNAVLSVAYFEAYRITKDVNYKNVVMETLDWVLREMSSPDTGGFFSAQDADTVEGEGVFYTWSKEDIGKALRDVDLGAIELSLSLPALVSEYYGVTNNGNFERERSVLTVSNSRIDSITSTKHISRQEVSSLAKIANRALFEFRSKRPRPSTDDKILVSWNGLMISAMSKAYQILHDERFIIAAKRASEFILETLMKFERQKIELGRSYRDGEKRGAALLEDYAFLAQGLIDLYEACFEPSYIEASVSICDRMVELFYDPFGKGFFDTDSRNNDLFARPKNIHDGAIPSGSSVALSVLMRLSELTGNEQYRERARETFAAHWRKLEDEPASHVQMLVALDFFIGPVKEVVLSGAPDHHLTRALLEAFRDQYIPNAVIALADSRIKVLKRLFEDRLPVKGTIPRAFVCSNFACKLPAASVDEFLSRLRE